jgi:hypothetical protein
VGLGAVLAVAIAVSLVLLLQVGRAVRPPPAGTVAARPARQLVTPSPIDDRPPGAPSSVVPTLDVEDLAVADPPGVSRSSSSTATTAVKAAHPATAATDAGAPGRPRTSAADADCNPPYTADARGHIHFKPNCL